MEGVQCPPDTSLPAEVCESVNQRNGGPVLPAQSSTEDPNSLSRLDRKLDRMRAHIHDGQEHAKRSTDRPDTMVQDPTSPASLFGRPVSSAIQPAQSCSSCSKSTAASSHSFVRPGAFLRPCLHKAGAAAHRRCQGWRSHRQRRRVLDGSAHGGMLDAVGATEGFRCRSQGLASLRDGRAGPPSMGMRKMKRNDLRGVLAVAQTAGTSGGAISLHPSSREGHLPPERRKPVFAS